MYFKNQRVERSIIEQAFDKFSELKVIVIGDAMVDSYLWGRVDRISPEAPIPIVTVTKQENRLGGAANVSMNLQSLGATPYLVSIIGDDSKGKKFQNLMVKNELSNEGIFVKHDRITTVKTRIISGGKQISRIDEEISTMVDSATEELLFEKVKSLIGKYQIDIILFVDYDKGVITPGLIEKVTALAKEKGILTAADPKIRNFNNYKGIDLFKPNFKEFIDGLRLNVEKTDLEKIKEAAEKFKKEHQMGLMFITLSENGVFISNGLTQNHFPAEVRDIADVSGAGDTVFAVASLSLAAGLSTKFIALLSNLAGGLVCEKSGVVPIEKESLKVEAMKILIG